MRWVKALMSFLPDVIPFEDSEAKARRETELRQRLERLEREVEVVQRVQTVEERQP